MIEPINVNTYRPGQDRDTAEKINEIIDYKSSSSSSACMEREGGIMSKNKDICCYKLVNISDNRVAYIILTDKKSIEEVNNDDEFDDEFDIVSVSEVLKVLNG